MGHNKFVKGLRQRQPRRKYSQGDNVGKILLLTFSDTEEKAIEKAIAALADMILLEAMQPLQSPTLTFPGLEMKEING